jgi:hypothetical protein
MAKQTSDVSNLPTLDDFTESSLLTQDDIKPAAAANADDDDDDGKANPDVSKDKGAAAPKKTDTAKATKADAVDETKKKAAKKDEKAEAAKAGAKADDAPKDSLTEAQYKALTAKADKDVDSLTEEEKTILINRGYLEEDAPATSFWDDVAKVHGLEIEVDFGDVDPESPQGAALRDQALVDKTVQDYLEYLKTNYPKAYKFLEHESNGGDINELFDVNKVDYSKVELKPENAEQQRKILVDYYKAKGFDEKRATRMMEADEDSEEGLFAAAKIALAEQQAMQKAEEAKVMQAAQERKAQVEARNNQFRGVVKQITEAGQIGNFVIQDKKEKEEFFRFAMGNIYSNGKDGYQVVLPITNETLTPVLQQLLFAYKEGDLSEFVKREAQTQNVRRLKRKVQQATNNSGGQEDNTQSQVKKLPTFDAFTVQGS